MMSDKCPFCDAPKEEPRCKDDVAYLYDEVYECGYDGNMPEEGQPKECMKRQIAALQERLEAWHTVVKSLDYDGTYFSAHIDWEKLHLLKDLKEIE